MRESTDTHQALKSDSFGQILLVRGPGSALIRRDWSGAAWWARPIARAMARREARALHQLAGLPATPALLASGATRLDRGYLGGQPMYLRPPRGDQAYFHAARRLLAQVHRLGIVHNDLAKEANWLVLDDGTPALVDFQLAARGDRRSRWMRLLAREDLRHLLKHKRTYCPGALTPVERRLLLRRSWVRELWFATGKPVYRFVTRRVLHWEDNEGRGPRP
ncbi:serine/threonine protein kinase [Pseudoxanthomonas koreensis]|uniref:serine/threonine protein kinase n=1 Tax=Pseudoxanthomonas koreensis TaxID=266061 RepID=UPI00139141D7|nr:serine/threonine protein kinase [Pseudoxanthomonas koreensis]KAF1691330.1 serine/threonine protein kinase [Pseudoxanthomonas koreensis]